MNNNQLGKAVSIESNIEEVKKLRDNQIGSLLRTPDLVNFLSEHYSTIAISAIKLEFLKRDLKELLQSPLDLVHYSASIRQIGDSNYDRMACLHLIEQEIKKLIDKY